MRMRKVTCFCVGVALVGVALLAALSAAEEGRGGAGAATRVLIVYHGGTPPWHGSAPLEQEDVHALTQATTQPINVASVADRIREDLAARGCVVDLRRAADVEGPDEFLPYDGIIFGTPTWFSNVAYPVKRLFDEHLIRIYEHRDGKLNDKVLSGFVTVMEGGESGPHALQCLRWGLEHLSNRLPEGVVVNVFEGQDAANAKVSQFCQRFAEALRM